MRLYADVVEDGTKECTEKYRMKLAKSMTKSSQKEQERVHGTTGFIIYLLETSKGRTSTVRPTQSDDEPKKHAKLESRRDGRRDG